jgi:hypothetical protein
MASVEQLALEFVLEHVEHRPPVDAGRLHPDHGHRPAAQPVRQRDQPCRGAAELADLLAAAAGIVEDAHARGDLRLVDVEHRAPLDQPIHGPSQGSRGNRMTARESLMRWSLNHVLKATVRGARDSRIPLITRLSGTKQSRRRPRRSTGLQPLSAGPASSATTSSSGKRCTVISPVCASTTHATTFGAWTSRPTQVRTWHGRLLLCGCGAAAQVSAARLFNASATARRAGQLLPRWSDVSPHTV